jgi:cytosine/adenosine deaminase-related metal-dependent hydrolase
MSGPVIRGGALAVVGGRIAAVGSGKEVAARFPRAQQRSYGKAVILPGLINAHVHLELSDLTPPARRASLADWLGEVVRRGPEPGEAGAPRIARAVELGVAQCLRFGVTSVGDISQRCAITRMLLRGGPLRVVSYGEVLAMATRRGLLGERLAVAADQSAQSEFLTIGISPHAPYSLEAAGYRRCLEAAKGQATPLATHLAESVGESEFLSSQSGPLRELWNRIGGWDEAVPKFSGGPVRFAQAMGYLDYPKSLLAHVNYCDDEELSILAAGRASVVYCPRTHAYFGHPPHRWREMLDRGINVAVGTDSCASSPDLNLVDDLRLLHKIAPDVPTHQLWEMATVRAAHAITSQGGAGTLAVDGVADFTVFPARGDDDPLREVLETTVLPTAAYISGNQTGSAHLK